MLNMSLQIALFAISGLALLVGVAILVFVVLMFKKDHKRLSKEEKARLKEENARKELIDRINAMNAELAKLNTKK